MARYGRADDQPWYDTLQACVNGHIITEMAESHPEARKNRCPECGAATISTCQHCGKKINGYKHIPGVAHMGGDFPAFCHECGNPYPWSKKLESTSSATVTKTALTNEVFVVHGHDEEMKQAVARVLSQLGLKPVILHEQPNHGRTLIEKFERNADVGFAVVLLSPDDMSYLKTADHKSAKPRARQNVILELGYFIGKLQRERVFTLKRPGELELPSDIAGVVYNDYDPAGHWKFLLARELAAVGYKIDANVLI